LLGLRAAPKDESGVSAGEAALGIKLAVPGQLLSVETAALDPPKHGVIPATCRSYADVVKSPSKLEDARWVFVKRGGQGLPLADNYDGPFEMLECGVKTCRVQMGAREEVVSRDRLKPFLGLQEPQVALPRRRGRPPRRVELDLYGDKDQGE